MGVAAKNKRALPAKVQAMKSRKRQKMGKEDPDAPTAASNKLHKPPRAPEKVRLDELAWKEVEMPDRLEDMEGFFGLEEIEDVDVHKADNGIVSYHADKAKKRVAEDEPDVEEDGDEEFTGFGDEDDDAGVDVDINIDEEKSAEKEPQKQETKKEKAKKEKALKNEKKEKPAKTEKKEKAAKAQKQKKDDIESSATFADLLDEEEDEGVDISAWRPLKLSDETLSSLSKMKFQEPTPIQRSSIPEILAGHDVIGKASTGSGKTLAFGIPILEKFLELQAIKRNKKTAKKDEDDATRSPALALILSPTRELAHQITKHMTNLCNGLSVRGPSIAVMTGGLSLLKQQRQLKTADIVIGTPGRLWEIISGGRGILKWLQNVQFLVVDEADRLLSQGHFKEFEEILKVLDRKDDFIPGTTDTQEEEEDDEDAPELEEAVERQTLVFSATFHKGLQQKLVGKVKAGANLMDKQESMEYLLKKLNFREEKPKYIDMNPVSQMAGGLKEGMVECAGTEKDLYLYALLMLHPNTRTLIFCNSISAVRRILPFLQNLQLPVHALHSQMIQKARMRSIERFTAASHSKPGSRPGSVLLATDVAARGLDIPNVDLVIHYHLPRDASTYVHRSGRTARAGERGSSIIICGPEEVGGVRRLVAKVHASSAAAGAEPANDAAKNGFFIRSLDIDRRVVARLKPRVVLSKQIADTTIAKEKKHSENDFLREAAEDLGVEYDSEEMENAPGKRGRGTGRKKKERENREITKEEAQGLRRQLKDMLEQRVNVGVSERYLTSGTIDIDALLRQQEAGVRTGEFLGNVSNFGMDD